MEIEKRKITTAEYTRMRALVGWRQIDTEAAQIALKNSLFSVVALENNELIGFGRVIGDGGVYYYVQDLIVNPIYQNKGVGEALVGEIMEFIHVNTKPGSFIGLMAAKGLSEYYKKFSFEIRDLDSPGMYQIVKQKNGFNK